MNTKYFSRAMFTIMYLSMISLHATHIASYYSIRSQGLNTPRHIAGVLNEFFTKEDDVIFGTVSAALAYNRSFDGEKITNCLFGTQNCPAITISGSRVNNRGANDWLADYFYLPSDFKSTISFDPVIDNITLDLNMYFGLDEWVDGLSVSIFAPLVHSRWNLHMCETIEACGTSTHEPGYFTPDTLQRTDLLNNFTEYANGETISPINQTVAGTDFTLAAQSLQKAKISSCRRNRTRFADIRTHVNYNFVQKEHCRVGFHALISAPSGTRPEGTYLFEPVIGNSHHWELGGGFSGMGIWKSENENKKVILFGDVTLSHLFSARQRRTFDLANKPFSRYMLMEKLGTPITDNLQGGGTEPSAQFKHEFAPVANVTNISVDTKIGLQAELTACASFILNNFNFNIGYNFWGRTCEQIKLHTDHPFENNTNWALKGDAHVYGFDRGTGGTGPLVGAIPLSATQSTATIYGGKNYDGTNTTAQARLNPNIDRPQDATGDTANATADYPLSALPYETAITIKTSIDPILLQATDIDVCQQETNACSSQFFAHAGYTWHERETWIPFIGFGAQVEFGHHSNCETDFSSPCDSCIRCSLSQWGVWFKGGLDF